MIEIIAHNLAPIMVTCVMALLLLGYPVAFTLAAGGLAFFFIGVELSVFAPDHIRLFPSLVQANATRTLDMMRGDVAVLVVGVFSVWFALSNIRPATRIRPGLAALIRDHGLAALAIALFALAPALLPFGPYELAAAAIVLVLVLRAMGMTSSRRPLHQVLEMTARATSAAMLVLIGVRTAGLTFYAINGHEWLDSLGIPIGITVTMTTVLSIILIYVLPIRAITRVQATHSGAAA